jgi:hypothetical protein
VPQPRGVRPRADRAAPSRQGPRRPRPIENLCLIEKLEDAIDLREARKVLAEMKRKGEKPIPCEKARRELSLK